MKPTRRAFLRQASGLFLAVAAAPKLTGLTLIEAPRYPRYYSTSDAEVAEVWAKHLMRTASRRSSVSLRRDP